ncbi:MAG TPA: PAS domain S-box protein [Nitrospira sp.]|nr:PAS domain S-box protein [Nitrospira sp.]
MADAIPPSIIEAAAYLKAIVDSTDDAIISKNLTGIIQTWNRAAERIFGYTAEEAIGQPILLIIPPERHDEEKTILARLRQGERIDHYETVRRRKDGRLIDIALTVSPVHDVNGMIIGASKIARDITERKQAKLAVAEAQSRLATTLESIGDAVLATDPQSLVTYLNPVAERLLGYSMREVMGRPLEEIFRIVNEETRQPVASPVERVLREGHVVGLANHTVLLRPDGSELPIDDSAAPIKDSDGRLLGAVLVFRDVSEQYKAARQAALLSLIVASSDDAILSKDLAGTITSWNRGAERIFGYTAEEMIGSSILRIIPLERQAEEAAILSKLRRGERVEHYETVRRKKDGRFCDISLTVSPLLDEDGNVIGASKIARDITEQKRAQRALHESEERWKVTLESIGDAVVATDAAAVVTFANTAVVQLLGRPSTEIIGRPLAEVFTIVNEETRRAVESPVDRVIRDGLVVGLANHTVVLRPDGSEVPIDDSAAPIRDREEQLVGVVLVFRDITERKQSESQLQRWSVELEARVRERTRELVYSQDRLRALASQLNLTEQRERRRLAANLHDSLAQLLALARMKLGHAAQRVNEDVAKASSSLTELDDLLLQCLQYTRTLMAQLSPSVLHDLGLVPALHWLAEKLGQQGLKVDVQVLTEEQPHFSETQADLLFQAVRELLTNVVRHAGVSKAIVSVDKQDSNTWLITVKDGGVGFDISTVHYTVSGEHFGLFSIQERMEAMSGWCRIDSTPGRGTKVELGLHVSPRNVTPTSSVSAAVTRVPEAKKPTQRSRWRVLLVDDHAMVRQGLRSILETYPDLEVIAEAADGLEAVEHATRHQPDVVVMDINLPKMNGIDATRRIKRDAPNTLVIGLSVQYSSQTFRAVLQAGGASLLSKEQATEDLYRTIIRFLDGAVN